MLYNDFQILSADKYTLMNEQFHQQHETCQTEILNQLFLTLDECKNFCLGANNNVNKRILVAIQYAKVEFEKLISNINICFELSVHSTNAVSNFNVFALAKKIVEGLKLTQQLFDFNSNKKVINFAKASQNSLLNVLSQLLDTLEKSNIHLFKYM